MKNIKNFNQFNESSMFSRFFGGDKTKDAAETTLKGQGYSHTGKDESNYIMFQGKKFYQDDIEYDDYHSTKPLPRIEGSKLIIANPIWNQ